MTDKVKVIVKPHPYKSSKDLLWVYSFVQMALKETNKLDESAYLQRLFANTEDKDYNELMDTLKEYADIEWEEKLN